MTTAERMVWLKLADVAREIFALPEVHPRDASETERDIHDLQNRLLARAAYPNRLGRQCPVCGRSLHGYKGPLCRYCDPEADVA